MEKSEVIKKMANAETQMDEAIVPQRLRELLKVEQEKATQYQAAAVEARNAINLGLEERNDLYIHQASKLLNKMGTVIDDHMDKCPHRIPAMASCHGECWRFQDCQCIEAVVECNRMVLRRCAYCAEPRGPLERINLIYDGSLRNEVEV